VILQVRPPHLLITGRALPPTRGGTGR